MPNPPSEESPSNGARNGPGLGSDLRDRVVSEAKKVVDAFDAASADPRAENLDRLRDAADRLMRAAGRVLIETRRKRGSHP